MILADSSAWVEYLRGAGTSVHHRLRQLIDDEADLAITEVVVLEVLAGARDDHHRDQLRDLIYRHPVLMTELADYERAADLYRACRRRGETVRKMTDCLIVAVAIREGASILHCDADFDVLARHTRLRGNFVDAPDDEVQWNATRELRYTGARRCVGAQPPRAPSPGRRMFWRHFPASEAEE